MSAEWTFLAATVALWVGGFLVFRAAALGMKLAAKAPSLDVTGTRRGLLLAVGFSIGLLALGAALPKDAGRPFAGEGIQVPVAWMYTPFWGWIAVLGAFMGVSMMIQAWLGLNRSEREAKAVAAAVWLGLAGLSVFLFQRFGGDVTIFRGFWFVNPLHFGAGVALILVIVAAGAFGARRQASRSRGKQLGIHVVLLAGCFIFGLPFAWLMSSSFKEDRDLAGGIVWIPRVTERVPFLDPKDPQFYGTKNGTRVTASVIETLPDGRKRLDIIEPFSMRGQTFEAQESDLSPAPKYVPVVDATLNGTPMRGFVVEELPTGERRVRVTSPEAFKGQEHVFKPEDATDVRNQGLRWQNYPESLQFLPPETKFGLVNLWNTILLVILNTIGVILSCAIVAYSFARLRFPGKGTLFKILLATMMLPGAVTLMPQFLIFKELGWIDTLLPLWVPSFFAGAFNVFLLRQFFLQIPAELEDAAKIDGCTYLRTFWSVMLPQIKPALAVIAIWTFTGTWNNFMGPLIYVNSPENMTIAYLLQLYNGERGGEPGLLMAFATMTMLPVLAVFFFAQKYFIEGVTLSGLGGR